MWKWQKEFVRQQDITGELFGRYIDDILMTWNKSEQQLTELLHEANQWHPNIKLDYRISQNLPFLDVLLTNNNGILQTSVYHKPTTEPYVVPFTSDHHPYIYANMIQTALARAVRYSSTFEAFNQEKRQIKLMFLYNGYSSSYIEDQFHKYFLGYINEAAFIPVVTEMTQFFLLRQKMLAQPTARQTQVARSIAAAAAANTTDEPSEDLTTITHENVVHSRDRSFIHYTHEKRFRQFKRDMHQLYQNVFQNTPAIAVKMVVGNRNRPDNTKELVHKRPKQFLLSNKYKKIKHLKVKKRHRQVRKRSK
ncbi:unnamed protein product [Adineta ricciae]|uniref:Helix-turn-helix domain-containing protein n=2 Tax=Adineta ricciae TaxID=249248 RepID=A0A816EXD9_ADIRI|nr:unnamed protein product [Adineta ricciae]